MCDIQYERMSTPILLFSIYIQLFTGVVYDQRGSTSLQKFTSTVWDDLKFAKALNNVEMNFVRIKHRIDMTMDELIEG